MKTSHFFAQDGRNPLHLAAANGHLDVMALLYERGVDPKVVTKVRLYLHYCFMSPHVEWMECTALGAAGRGRCGRGQMAAERGDDGPQLPR